MHDLGIAARGKQMTRVVETLKGEGKLVRSMAENIVTYHLEVVEETGIAPRSPGLRTIAGCVNEGRFRPRFRQAAFAHQIIPTRPS